MLKLKIALFIYFNIQASLATDLYKSGEQFDSLKLPNVKPLSNEEAALVPKANWQPICQEVIINNFEISPVEPESEVVLLPQELPGIVLSPVRKNESCIAPNGGGLTAFLREAYELLPHVRLNAIKQAAAKDPEVKKFTSLITSTHFQNQVATLLKTNAFIVLRDYACQKLQLDVDELLQFEASIFGWDSFEKHKIMNRASSGVQGLLQDIISVLPIDQLKSLLKNKLETDEYLRKAKDLIKSNEFHQIVEAVKQQPEYVALKNELKINGFIFNETVEHAKIFVYNDF